MGIGLACAMPPSGAGAAAGGAAAGASAPAGAAGALGAAWFAAEEEGLSGASASAGASKAGARRPKATKPRQGLWLGRNLPTDKLHIGESFAPTRLTTNRDG